MLPGLSRVKEGRNSQTCVHTMSQERETLTLGLVLSFCTLFTLSGCIEIAVLTEVFRLETSWNSTSDSTNPRYWQGFVGSGSIGQTVFNFRYPSWHPRRSWLTRVKLYLPYLDQKLNPSDIEIEATKDFLLKIVFVRHTLSAVLSQSSGPLIQGSFATYVTHVTFHTFMRVHFALEQI